MDRLEQAFGSRLLAEPAVKYAHQGSHELPFSEEKKGKHSATGDSAPDDAVHH
jgi:hypothetical protein